MPTSDPIFSGVIPALMTPCSKAGEPNFDALAATGKQLIDAGMRAAVYCGSMGDWPLLRDSQRQAGVDALLSADVPVVVGTGALSTDRAVAIVEHAANAGAQGLMVIPRVLSRGTSPGAQREHFKRILEASSGLPAVIYNSPYYGFETKADLFFELHDKHPNLIGFKEFGGANALSYAAEHITSRDALTLMVGVDTQVVHGFVRCAATGAITGVGNALPEPVLRLIALCEDAAMGNPESLRLAKELDAALSVLAKFDEGPDLVLYYKRLMVLEGNSAYENQLNSFDILSDSQRNFVDSEWRRFRQWWDNWPGATLSRPVT